MKKEPIRHHYIPQFLIRNFCFAEDMVHYWNRATNGFADMHPRDVFMVRNLYRDENSEDALLIEKEFSKYEREMAKLIREKFLKPGSEVHCQMA